MHILSEVEAVDGQTEMFVSIFHNISAMSTKAVVGRALRETGAALKQASGAEVRLLLVVMVVVVCGYILARRPERAVWRPKVM